MPFILKKYPATIGKTIQILLLQDLGLKHGYSQRMLSRKRVFDTNMNAYKNSDLVHDDHIYIAEFEGHTRGLQPLLTFKDFALFDKPSHLMIHPNSKNTKYSLLDEIRYHFGEKANQAHRIDAETSGLLLLGLQEKAVKALATMFENKEYKKSYLALVEGEIKEDIKIDYSLKKEGKNIGVRMAICEEGDEGKESLTYIKPIEYNKEKNITLVEAIPHTGRQHQIRVHLYAVGHRIVGDPIYGINDVTAEEYLDKTLSDEARLEATGASRLWLHANYLEFFYKKVLYKIYSKNKSIYNEFKS
ncbi:MAG: RluA family pseudouridine synthase [Campylobacterales bacterium]|nr:RluA family pseudouridine synthase [Campylobacterales bacterium]NQY52436.1 RluA family pseudouridine synthase [Campylobacteraceae bacterium]